MKKRAFAITFILMIILTMFAHVAVFADDDDYGADAHSESMGVIEEGDYEEELSFKDMLINTVTDNIQNVVLGVVIIVLVIVFVKLIKSIHRRSEPKYKGRH